MNASFRSSKADAESAAAEGLGEVFVPDGLQKAGEVPAGALHVVNEGIGLVEGHAGQDEDGRVVGRFEQDVRKGADGGAQEGHPHDAERPEVSIDHIFPACGRGRCV